MTHDEITLTRRRAQLTQLAQMRNLPFVGPFDRQMINELFHKDPADLTDKDMEMIQTLADRYLIEVAA